MIHCAILHSPYPPLDGVRTDTIYQTFNHNLLSPINSGILWTHTPKSRSHDQKDLSAHYHVPQQELFLSSLTVPYPRDNCYFKYRPNIYICAKFFHTCWTCINLLAAAFVTTHFLVLYEILVLLWTIQLEIRLAWLWWSEGCVLHNHLLIHFRIDTRQWLHIPQFLTTQDYSPSSALRNGALF